MRSLYSRLVFFTALFIGVVFFYLYPGSVTAFRSFPDLLFSRSRPTPAMDESARLAETEKDIRMLQEENAALKRSLAVSGTTKEPRLLVHALWHDPDPSRQAIRTTIPRDATVHVGDVVLAPGDIFVGKVVAVFSQSADVLLISDVTFRAGARLEENTGLVVGAGKQLVMKYLPAQVAITEGSAIYTSGLEGQVPAGLLLGWAGKTSSALTDPFRTISVLLAADFEHLQTLFILPYLEK